MGLVVIVKTVGHWDAVAERLRQTFESVKLLMRWMLGSSGLRIALQYGLHAGQELCIETCGRRLCASAVPECTIQQSQPGTCRHIPLTRTKTPGRRERTRMRLRSIAVGYRSNTIG